MPDLTLQRTIVALDSPHPEAAFRLVDDLGDLIDIYKIGPVLNLHSGKEVIEFLHRRGKKVFLDLKLHDIPKVVYDTVVQMADLGVSFSTVHCSGGMEMLRAASLACRNSPMKLLGITLLTSLEDRNGTIRSMLDLAMEARLAGIVSSPHEIIAVKKSALPGFLLVTPGIRLPGQRIFQDDQKRVASPREALVWGADYIVVGRPISSSPNPREVASQLFK